MDGLNMTYSIVYLFSFHFDDHIAMCELIILKSKNFAFNFFKSKLFIEKIQNI